MSSSVENFEQSNPQAAPTRVTFDWVKEKAAEVGSQARHYLADKSNRELALDGVTLAAGFAASALLHVNMSKSAKVVEEIFAGRTETAAIKGTLSNLSGEAHGVALEDTLFKAAKPSLIKSLSSSSADTLHAGGFTLPEGMSFQSATKVPPRFIQTNEQLPCPSDLDYDQVVAKRFNIRIDLAEPNSIGILHPRFRNGSKQLAMIKSLDRNLSLYGNDESGVGVLEFLKLPTNRPYFKHADSVVQITFSHGSAGVGSGTLISEDGLIATAGHVIPPDRRILVHTPIGRFKAEVIFRRNDEEVDLGAIQMLGVPKGITFPVPTMTSLKLTKGMRAAAIGHPQGLSGQFASVGTYLKDLNYVGNIRGPHPTFLLDSVVPGNSGGPIFDREGNFAVVVAKMFTPEEVSPFAKLPRGIVTGNRIEDLLDFLKQKRQV